VPSSAQSYGGSRDDLGRLKKCFAEGCETRISRRLLMCKPHWSLVPKQLQIKVCSTLAAWQVGDSPVAYINAIKRARIAVAEAHGNQGRIA
jgi:hypothetical protein